ILEDELELELLAELLAVVFDADGAPGALQLGQVLLGGVGVGGQQAGQRGEQERVHGELPDERIGSGPTPSSRGAGQASRVRLTGSLILFFFGLLLATPALPRL